jgi:hypothetical protein
MGANGLYRLRVSDPELQNETASFQNERASLHRWLLTKGGRLARGLP